MLNLGTKQRYPGTAVIYFRLFLVQVTNHWIWGCFFVFFWVFLRVLFSLGICTVAPNECKMPGASIPLHCTPFSQVYIATLGIGNWRVGIVLSINIMLLMWVSKDICLKSSLPKFHWANTCQWWRTEGSGSDIEDYSLIDKTKMLKRMSWDALSLLLLNQSVVSSTCEV